MNLQLFRTGQGLRVFLANILWRIVGNCYQSIHLFQFCSYFMIYVTRNGYRNGQDLNIEMDSHMHWKRMLILSSSLLVLYGKSIVLLCLSVYVIVIGSGVKLMQGGASVITMPLAHKKPLGYPRMA